MKKFISILFLVLSVQSCDTDNHIEIELTDKHLETVPSGEWLKVFNVDYQSPIRLKKQIADKLNSDGILLDETIHKENANDVKTYLWKYNGHVIKEQYYRGGIWGGPKVIPYMEYDNGLNTWITIEFKDPIPYSELIPEHFQKLDIDRKYEHAATIISIIDQEKRLFLFGYGNYCTKISLY